MSKRGATILVGVVILGLFAAIIGYFASAGFQAWVQTWLGNPVGLAATATTIAAIATLLAVVVGLRGIYIGRALAHEAFEQTEKALVEGRNQFMEAQYNANRPLLIPTASDLAEQYEPAEPITYEWNATSFVTIQNVGNGIATNIWIAILPPAPSPDYTYQNSSQLGSPLAAASDPVKVYLRSGGTLFVESDSLNRYPLYIPSDRASGSTERTERFIARLNMTYQDIFGRKHASIFDLSDQGIWINVAFLSDIERDLGEINAAKTRTVVAVEAQA